MAQYRSQFTGAEIDERLGQVPGLVADVEELKENGVGTPGEDGGYYRPNVDAGGNLTFTPSKASMPSVAGANVTGPKGEDGTSVTITNVSISNEPGGVSTITFSDGTVISIRNGNNGQDLTEGAYMPSEDPTGTGALSVNRAVGTTVGEKSAAFGYNCEAAGRGSTAEGVETAAVGIGQHVEGIHNVRDTEMKYLHIVGNGPSAAERRNAHTLDRNGNAWFRGDIFIGGEDQDSGTNIKDLIPSAGEAGKSAYQYAVEGGYKGTEEEFAKKLAIEEYWYATVEYDRIRLSDMEINSIGSNIPITVDDLKDVDTVQVWFDNVDYGELPVEYKKSSSGHESVNFGVDDVFNVLIMKIDGINYPSIDVFGEQKSGYWLTVDSFPKIYNKMPAGFLPEAVDYIVLNSTGSNKQFKITVDDSGNLTATELA